MGFNPQKYMQTQFKRREQAVSVPDLASYFGEDEKPEWTVKGLTGQELAMTNEAVKRNQNMSAILEGIASNRTDEIKEAISKLAGCGDGVPDDVAKRVSMLSLGSIDPKVDESLAVHLCTNNPIEFYQITNVITRLTGLGYDPGKLPPSGKTAE